MDTNGHETNIDERLEVVKKFIEHTFNITIYHSAILPSYKALKNKQAFIVHSMDNPDHKYYFIQEVDK